MMFATGKTDNGKLRSHNEDAILLIPSPIGPLPNLFVVADGMGGHNGGETASREAIDFFCQYIGDLLGGTEEREPLDLLIGGMNHANSKVLQHGNTDMLLAGMGTTFSACVIWGMRLVFAHVGDSRIYVVRNHTISQLTYDHTFVNEMVKAGRLTPSEAATHPRRNILTRALGTDTDFSADGGFFDLTGQDIVVLCSDGLTNMVSDADILRIADSDASLAGKTDALVDLANQNGGIDNISVILIDVKNADIKP